jgi:hypothetical protein
VKDAIAIPWDATLRTGDQGIEVTETANGSRA